MQYKMSLVRSGILLLAISAFTSPFLGANANLSAEEPVREDTENQVIRALNPTSIKVEPATVELDGRFAYRQLIVTGRTQSGETVDLTRVAKIASQPKFVSVDENRLITSLANGQGKLVISWEGLKAEVKIQCKNFARPFESSFRMHVQPVLSRLGCNAGTCHGSKDGKNGFKLSLRGYDPVYDYRALTDDLSARRFNKAAPDRSLFLLKSSGAVPHAGGAIVQPGSPHYEILRNWISQGAKYDSQPVPKVTSLQVFPQNPIVPRAELKQQLRVLATFSDGSQKDVTREAFVESGNIEVAETEAGGKLKLLRRGEAAALVRYEGAYAATTLTVMGDRRGFVWQQPEVFNYVDRHVYNKLKRVKVSPGERCSDAEFVRRIHLDLTGLPPSVSMVKEFIRDTRPSRVKRDALVDRLIGSPEFVDHWTNKWSDLLQVNRKFLGEQGAVALRNWIRQSISSNKPYNQFAREILVARGSNLETPPAAYYKVLRQPDLVMENTTHLFLAIRFNCNKCHDHPFERWTQDQYYELAAFFAQVGRKPDPSFGNQKIAGSAVERPTPLVEVIFDQSDGELKHERTGVVTAPDFPFTHEDMPTGKSSRRERLADWLTSAENPYFARSFVNRLWGYLLGKGIIDPIDDIRAGNPPTNPELLDALEREFIESGFNVRRVIATICKSRVYQHSLKTNRWNEDDTINFSHYLPRRLQAETLYDSIHFSLGAPLNIPGAARGIRAAQLPDSGVRVPFLDDFGRPARESACECERSEGVVLGPVMKLINGPTIAEALKNPKSELNQLIQKESDDRRVVEEIFLRLLARKPSEKEIRAALETIQTIEVTENSISQTLADYESRLLERQADWEKNALRSLLWHPAQPVKMQSEVGAVFSVDAQSVVKVSGKLAKDIYRLEFTPSSESLTGVRIEALQDAKLPAKGPGRAENGNFVLNELQLFLIDPDQPDKPKPVRLKPGKASFSQGGFPFAHAIDGNRNTGWAISPQLGKNQMAYFELNTDLQFHKGAKLQLVLIQQYSDGKHNLGKFRISFTDSPRPFATKKLPENLLQVLRIEPAMRTAEQSKMVREYYLAQDAKYAELSAAAAQVELEKANPRQTGFQDLAWAIINSPAFLFNR